MASFVTERERGSGADAATSAEAAGTLVWFLDTGNLDRRRYAIVNRLQRLHDRGELESLPEDLRARIREILAEAER